MNYKLIWQTTCSACLMRGSRISIKLDLQVFMHKTFYLGFISSSNSVRSEKEIKNLLKKTSRGPDLTDLGRFAGSPAHSTQARAGERLNAWQEGLGSQWMRWLKGYGAPPAVWSKGDQRLRVVFLPATGSASGNPSGGQAGCEGSPGGFPWRRQRVGATRRRTASSERVGISGLGSERQICATAVVSSASGLAGTLTLVSLGQREGRVS
jgi:hypothetical protein